MPDLVAQGPRRPQRWRKPVPLDEPFELGRQAGEFSANWDSHVSRSHVRLKWNGKTLHLESFTDVANPVFFGGQQIESAVIRLGEHFVIGQTTFTLVDEMAGLAGFDGLVTEQTFAIQHIRHHRFLDPAARLEIISKLPERIAASLTEAEIYEQLVRCVFEGAPSAETVALCCWENDQIRFLYWDRTGTGSLQVSRRLITKAIESRETVLHTWEPGQTQGDGNFTTSNSAGWAFSTPFQGEQTRQWALYVSGVLSQGAGGADLRDDLKFAEIVTTTVGSFVEVRKLQQRQSALGQFFSEPVIAAISDEDPEQALKPREVEVTVLFCDLRGFSLATERSEHDLLGLLHRVSDALGVLTSHILSEGGVIGDFHGDAAMGFLGLAATARGCTPPSRSRCARDSEGFCHDLDSSRSFVVRFSDWCRYCLGTGGCWKDRYC